MADMKTELQVCIDECETALRHLNNALESGHSHAKPKLEQAKSSLEECIAECRSAL
ncbi:hypothetical protein [Planococcus lenghuensis]|uniref:hypothetical protein n=1 Tax=Planococcus lenghuensis TaxID=2213202 RepID=UPI0012EB5C21|nr:hypothetical protein [Planococcus lenghuensis]